MGNSSSRTSTPLQRFLIAWFRNMDFSPRIAAYEHAFLITLAFSRLSAEITTQLPSAAAGSAAKAPTNYFPRGSPPKVTRHTSPIRGPTKRSERWNHRSRPPDIRRGWYAITLQTYFMNKWNKFLYGDHFYFNFFRATLSFVPVYQVNESYHVTLKRLIF